MSNNADVTGPSSSASTPTTPVVGQGLFSRYSHRVDIINRDESHEDFIYTIGFAFVNPFQT